MPSSNKEVPKSMRRGALVLTLLLITCGGKSGTGLEKGLEAADLLPRDHDIQGWRRSGSMQTASSDDELYAYIDGAAVLYIDHGFEAYAEQRYSGPEGVEVEAVIYDQGSVEHVRALYEDPQMVPSPSKAVEDLGEDARVDEGGLFHYTVEFIQDRFFVRVTIQDKSDDGLNTAILFALHIAQNIR